MFVQKERKMKTVYLLIGLPGAGKSTFAKKELSKAKVVELDSVRQVLSNEGIIGKTYSSADNKVVFEYFHKEILAQIERFDEVVVDATNARLSERQEIYTLLADIRPKFVVVNFVDDKETVVARIKKRQEENPNCVHVFENPEEAVEIYANRINESPATFEEPIAEIWYVKNCEIVDKKQKVLIASTNAGKIAIYKQVCDSLGMATTSLRDIYISEQVDETAPDEVGNAILKAEAYHRITGLPVIANDSGLVIDRFKPEDQPGVLVRRFTGRELTDQEMLEVFIEKLNEVGGESEGHYNVALAIIDFNGKLHTQTFKPVHHFINKPSKVLKKGVPLSSLCYDKVSGKYESEMTPEERNNLEKEGMAKQVEFIKTVFCQK